MSEWWEVKTMNETTREKRRELFRADLCSPLQEISRKTWKNEWESRRTNEKRNIEKELWKVTLRKRRNKMQTTFAITNFSREGNKEKTLCGEHFNAFSFRLLHKLLFVLFNNFIMNFKPSSKNLKQTFLIKRSTTVCKIYCYKLHADE